jgi:hypothetical protein
MRVLIATFVVSLAAAAGAAGQAAPRIALVSADPAVVTGAGFAPHARVVVSYRSGATKASRTVVASRRGAFRLVLGTIAFKRCSGLSLTAGTARIRVGSCAAGGAPELIGNPGGQIAGSRFVPGEVVKVTAKLGTSKPISGTAVAGGNGAFSLRLPLTARACSALLLHASGSLGSSATYELPAPDCMAP